MTGTQVALEFKGTTLPVISLVVRSANLDEIETVIADRLSRTPLIFQDEAVVIAAHELKSPIDWLALKNLLSTYHIYAHFISGLTDEQLITKAQQSGFVVLDDIHLGKNRSSSTANTSPRLTSTAQTHYELPDPMIISAPIRSGQQIYAKNRDLIILNLVNNGAEIVADGSIHVYAPLRGRALAGASGNVNARIFSSFFEAELVSIGGIYQTFDNGIPPQFIKKSVHIQLIKQESAQLLSFEEIKTLPTVVE